MKTHLEHKTQLLFTENIHLTGVTEYGIRWDELLSGEVVLPPQGARFDITFEGTFAGPDLKGTIEGTDYLTVRADGKFMLNIYATITTEEGIAIPIREQGPVMPGANGRAHLQLAISFTTNAPKYAWLNQVEGWAIGEINMNTRAVTAEVYTGAYHQIPATA